MKKWFFYLNFENIWLFFCSLALSGAVIYAVYALNVLGASLAIVTALVATVIFRLRSQGLIISLNKKSLDLNILSKKKSFDIFWLYFGLSLASIISALITLFNNQSTEALISPWSVLPTSFYILLFLANLFTLLSLRTKGQKIFKQFIFSTYLFLIFAIAAIIYQLGYGFDPHVHYASLQEIIRAGYILPKTPYYLGQYSIIISLHRFLGLSLQFLNTYLLAIAAALTIPCLLNYLSQEKRDSSSALTASLLLVLLGFSPFIINTPQNFSYLFLLATVVFVYKRAKSSLIILSALATFTIHPLAGLPAILIASYQVLGRYLAKGKTKKNTIAKIVATSLKPINAAIIFLTTLSLAIWSIAAFSPLKLTSLNIPFKLIQLPNTTSYFLNLSYSYIANHHYLIIVLIILIISLRKKIWTKEKKEEKRRAKLLATSAMLSLTVYLISTLIYFPALIAYEQDGYTRRLLSIALIISLPLFFELFYYLSKRAKTLTKVQQLIILITLPLLLLIAIYGSYPRFDRLYNSRGYSSSSSDVEAVLLAEKLANGEQYIALANQQVSAMALKELGFHNRYLIKDGQEFYFYPIPTGGDLYQYFLDLSYIKADRETVIRAMDYAGVNRAYLIVNRYWWASPKIIAEAKLSADSWYKVGEENNYLFEYQK